ncbi:MAG: tlde1 domain-containing protein [Roseibium sp.]
MTIGSTAKANKLSTALTIAGSALVFKVVILSIGLLGPNLSPKTTTQSAAVAVIANNDATSPAKPQRKLAKSAVSKTPPSNMTLQERQKIELPGRLAELGRSHIKQPTQLAKANAKSALAIHLAKLKLKSALIAARNAAKQTKPVEISPEPNAVVAVATPAPILETPVQDVAQTIVVAALQTELHETIDEQIDPLAGAAIATRSTPVPGKRPRPLVQTKPGAITKPVQSAQPVLAYAAPGNPEDDKTSLFSGLGKVFKSPSSGLPGRSSGVAVYDISTATVHMPDGTKLEAHSGIGHRKDKAKYAYVKNLGPTPPNVYKLRMRERLFHGVEAIRMLPQDRAAMKGRDGMLAHTPLLRRTNGSHGCVAFKNYKKFLKAFKAGKVKTMIVVPSMNKLPTYMAKLERKSRV